MDGWMDGDIDNWEERGREAGVIWDDDQDQPARVRAFQGNQTRGWGWWTDGGGGGDVSRKC